ncbi:MAG: Hsp20/alpha crystallin family protein [Pseudomonadota bacterium]
MSDHGSRRGSRDGADLGLGGLFEALGDAVAEVTRQLEDGQTSVLHRSYEVDTGKGPVRAEAGVRVRFAGGSPGGDPDQVRAVNRPTGQANATQEQVDTESVSRPVEYDVFETASEWRLTADLPGVGADDLVLSDGDGQLVIEATGDRRYRDQVPVPAFVRSADLDVHLKNGILVLSQTAGEGL